jgi:hypothetical protein
MQAGALAFWSFIHTGQVRRLETAMVLVGGIAHIVLIIACLAALRDCWTTHNKWWKFIGGGVVALAYLALIVAIARPR